MILLLDLGDEVYFMGKKIDTLANLYDDLFTCHEEHLSACE